LTNENEVLYANKKDVGYNEKRRNWRIFVKPTAWKRATEIIEEPCVVSKGEIPGEKFESDRPVNRYPVWYQGMGMVS